MIKERNAEIGLAVEQLYRISASDKVRVRYELREKAWRDEYARLVYSQQEGRQEGRQEGLLQGLQEGIQEGIEKHKADMLKLINEGLTTEQIRARLLGEK